MRTHGALTEDSRSRVVRTPDRKGREGKRREEEERADFIHPQVEGADRELAAHLTTLPFPAMNEKTQR